MVILGWLLGDVARWFSDGLVVNAQLYFHAFRIDNVRSPWVWAPMRFLSSAVLQYSAVTSWGLACGYWCAPRNRTSAHPLLWVFTVMTLAGTMLTTTSVRIAQPAFFDTFGTAVVYPTVVKALFVVLPAWAGSRALRGGAASPVTIVLVAAIGIMLAWSHASDL